MAFGKINYSLTINNYIIVGRLIITFEPRIAANSSLEPFNLVEDST